MVSPWRPAAGVARLLSHPARHIRWKIILPFMALTLAIAVAGTYLTTRVVAGSLAERFDNQLAEAARVTSDSFVRRERRHLEVIRAVSFTEGVAAAVANADREALRRLVLPIAANTASDRLEVLDGEGSLLFGVRLLDVESLRYATVAAGEPYARWPIVAGSLARRSDPRGDKFSGVLPTADGEALYTAGPIFDGARLAGVVLVGSRLDGLLPAIKLEALADVTLYAPDGSALASTFAAGGAGELSARRRALDELGAATAVRETRALFGRDFDLLYGVLNLRDAPVAVFSVSLPSSFIASAASVTRLQMTVLFSIAAGGVLFTGWLLASALSRPITALAGTARAVVAGDLSARSGVRTRDEIGVLAQAFDSMTAHLQRQHLSTIQALASAIDARDPYTLGHSVRVGRLALELGAKLGLSKVELQNLEIGGYLHDIGKIGVRDAVLLKAGGLTAEEKQAIEDHPRIGLRMFEAIEVADGVREFILSHHEKLDGTGYPQGLRAAELSAFARIGAVADIYDALTTERPYKPAFKVERALDILCREARAGRLDLSVVNALEDVVPAWEVRRSSDPALKGLVIVGGGLAAVS